MGTMVLASVCLIALVLAAMHHYSLFYTEYRLSTWQNGIAAYAPWITLGFAIIFIISIAFQAFSFSSKSNANAVPAAGAAAAGATVAALAAEAIATPMAAIQNAIYNSSKNLPPANTATNYLTSTINNGLNYLSPTNKEYL